MNIKNILLRSEHSNCMGGEIVTNFSIGQQNFSIFFLEFIVVDFTCSNLETFKHV